MRPEPTARDEAIWDRIGIVGPLAALVLPLLAGWLLGAFDNFVFLSNEAVTPLQAFTMLGAMLFRCASFLYAQGEWNRAQAHASRRWPTVPGVVGEPDRQQVVAAPSTVSSGLSYRCEVGRDGYDGDMAMFGPS